jgi:hypothetical protein
MELGSMDQQHITQLLDHSNDAGAACRDALLDGAELILWQGTAPADMMADPPSLVACVGIARS